MDKLQFLELKKKQARDLNIIYNPYEEMNKRDWLIVDDLRKIHDQKELLLLDELFILHLRENKQCKLSLTETAEILRKSPERIKKIHSKAKRILSRGYREHPYPKRTGSMRQDIVAVLEKDIEVYRAIVAKFSPN